MRIFVADSDVVREPAPRRDVLLGTEVAMSKALDVNENIELAQRETTRDKAAAPEKTKPVQGKALRVNENTAPEQKSTE